ncbi:uncharacterized protein [Arachis hypogaea]|uniref:uncharacterized protein n=1 Tax=Arachis hypogaea TaxID=3818 RepID=UPI003B213A93
MRVDRDVKLKAMNFVVIGDELYKRSIEESVMSYLGQSEKIIAFGEVHEVLHLEINLNTIRVMYQEELPVEDYWNAMFDELNNLDSDQMLALDHIIHQKENVAHIYNRRVKEKCFQVGELVLMVILPMEKKSRFYGKWSHNWESPFQVIDLYYGNACRIKNIDSSIEVKSVNGKYLKRYRCWENND